MITTQDQAMQQGEARLAQREPAQAAASFDLAESLGAPADQCAGRRWTCHMLGGDFARAWIENDAMRARGAADVHRVWDGTAIAGKQVMVRSLHGFGDAIQMIRYAPLLRQQASRVTVQVAPQLVELVRCAGGIDEVVAWERERPYDLQLEITELPYLFRSTLHTLPSVVPYLALPAKSAAEARAILGESRKPRVGLVWSGSAWDSARSIPFPLLHPLLHARDDVDFWCLQPGAPEWDNFCAHRGWAPRRAGDSPAATFAACIEAMDLVITTDTFAAHLAGALARPTWLLLRRQADWRWMIDRDDSPWYPTLRLFRQQVEGNWEPVIAEATQQLISWHGSSPAVEPAPVCLAARAR